MISTKGKLESVVGVQNVLKLFYEYFGLQLNCAKSEFYCASINKELVEEMQSVTGFKCGILLVRYLGVPLVTRRLSFIDCSSLIERVKARINSWSSKLLSYAGRLQLIHFWCRHFLSPNWVLRRINQLFSGFL